MNPIKVSESLHEAFVSYLTTTFDVNRNGRDEALAKAIEASFNQPNALFRGPYLELTPPYKTGKTLASLVKEGVLSPKLLDLPCFAQNRPLPPNAPLYTHQEKAIRKLCSPPHESVVISSGTGSGKTEGFLIPILNDLLMDPSPGVRAVLIYPMNALVNDQLDRLRVLLRGTNITFGRYTSELAYKEADARRKMEEEWKLMDAQQKALLGQYPLPNEIIGRDQIREQGTLPQILITNYAMLEYLLLRPVDNSLFVKGQWRFIVLDEAHSYAGAQGIEVGMLMRRLKHRLGKEPGETLCIATSATLTDDDAQEAANFAKALFDEKFETDDIIFGDPNYAYVPEVDELYQPDPKAYIHPHFEQLLTEIRQPGGPQIIDTALLMDEMGLIPEEDYTLANSAPDTPAFLWQTLQSNRDIFNLRQAMVEEGTPIAFGDVAARFFAEHFESEADQKEALYHLIELAALARPSPDKPSLLPARYHLFARPPQGLWVCLNPNCSGREHQTDSGWSRLYAEPRERCESCEAAVYPLTVCRTCGQPYLRMEESNRQFLAEADEVEAHKIHYFTWSLVEEDKALGTDEEELDEEELLLSELEGSTPFSQEEFVLCLACCQQVRNTRCGCESNQEKIHIPLYHVVKEEKKGRNTRMVAVEELNECPRCRDKSYSGTEVVTELSMSAMVPLSIVTEELYQQLPTATAPHVSAQPGGGRKLLAFYDSRQGAARFAAHLQDAVNQNTYNHLIPIAVEQLEQRYKYADFQSLCEKTMKLALENRVFHNDITVDSKNVRDEVGSLGIHDSERLERPIRARVMAQFTTGRRARRSLETLCLVGVFYAQPGNEPDVSRLATQIGLTEEQTWTLIGYLLDDLRRSKVITLPEGVTRDDPAFGRNRFSPGVVRSNNTQYQVAWIGKTPRHRRRRLVQKALGYAGQPQDEENVVRVLELLWEWLTRPGSAIFDTSRPADGFQIRHERLIFQTNPARYQCRQCRRFSYRGDTLPCPHSYCQGTLELVSDSANPKDNFYVRKFNTPITPMRVEEHTAQLTSEKGQQYQDLFKNGQINVLSCSTTFEMGIDLGDLQSVVMSNVPPTVSNYKQRAGRAGRRASGTAFILVWASERPHDQTYFKAPPKLISGNVRVPHIEINNELIIQRHVNAILLSEFLRYRQRIGRSDLTETGSFFDEQTDRGPHYDFLSEWLKTELSQIQQLLERFAPSVNAEKEVLFGWQNEFSRMMRERGAELYKRDTSFFKQALQELATQLTEQITSGDLSKMEDVQNDLKQFRGLLNRSQQEMIINYLSDKGVLPSYSFPLHTVNLRVNREYDLRLQRDLRQAIREYAPGQEIVANKRIWRSGGLDFFGKEPLKYHYRICPLCNHLDVNETPGMPLTDMAPLCSICGNEFRNKEARVHQFIVPDGFHTDSKNSGQAAGQYVKRETNLTKSALLPGEVVEAQPVSGLLELGYDRQGKLLYVNEGSLGLGFKICMKCGRALNKAGKCNATYRGQKCDGTAPADAIYSLGFMENTDTLHLRFFQTAELNTPAPEDREFWLSLKYALLHGASHALQIEQRDIDGVLFPRAAGGNWRQTIVLYDNVPGGAGHVKRIQEEIISVVGAALDIVDCECAEDTSCYRCLRDYNNQWEHHLLVRGRVIPFLTALYASLSKIEGEISGLYEVAANDPGRWLVSQIEAAQQKVSVVATRLTLQSPDPQRSWLDIFHSLLLRGVTVHLYLAEQPKPTRNDPNSLIVAEQLRSLLTRGLILEVSKRPAEWQVIIDENTDLPRTIKAKTGQLPLDESAGTGGLFSTTHRQAVRDINANFEDFAGRTLDRDALRLPPDVQVLDTAEIQKKSERELFSTLFEQPIIRLDINDRYLLDEERIYHRLGAYIELAAEKGALEKVAVFTYPAGDNKVRTQYVSKEEQNQAIDKIKKRFPEVDIQFKRTPYAEHDRYITLTRKNGSKARILIGKGLDFIQSDGRLQRTFIVIEDPFSG